MKSWKDDESAAVLHMQHACVRLSVSRRAQNCEEVSTDRALTKSGPAGGSLGALKDLIQSELHVLPSNLPCGFPEFAQMPGAAVAYHSDNPPA